MTEFSQILQKYLDDNQISCRHAAVMSGIERTSLQKWLNGKRNPQNLAKVRKLGSGLGMSEKDIEQLCKAYQRNKKKRKNKEDDTIYRMIDNIYHACHTCRTEATAGTKPASFDITSGRKKKTE